MVAYTGTHDNDTTLGWFNSATEDEKSEALKYVGYNSGDICWDFIRLAFRSIANVAVVPLQDVLRLGSEARMNYPGKAGGNWGWRFKEGALSSELTAQLLEITELYGRTYQSPDPDNEDEDALIDLAVKKSK